MRERHSLGATVDSELGEQPLDVRGNRLGADEELGCDLLLVVAAREEHEYLQLSRRQRAERGGYGSSSLDARGGVAVTEQKPAYPCHQLVGVEWLDDADVCADQECPRRDPWDSHSRTGDEDDGECLSERLTQLVADLVPRDAGNADVE